MSHSTQADRYNNFVDARSLGANVLRDLLRSAVSMMTDFLARRRARVEQISLHASRQSDAQDRYIGYSPFERHLLMSFSSPWDRRR